jgi:hypothetical protein
MDRAALIRAVETAVAMVGVVMTGTVRDVDFHNSGRCFTVDEGVVAHLGEYTHGLGNQVEPK